jgi:signal transduction histidine kinase
MPEGGTLTLITYGTEENIVLEVSDTGSGIPEGIDVFKPFITTKSEGTGLGLYVVQRIVSAHTGTVDFSSNHGRGTTFLINLPRKLRSLQKSSDVRL